MEQARIIHFEPEELWQQRVAEYLGEVSTHQVISIVEHYEQLTRAINGLKSGAVDANVLLVSSQLNGSQMYNLPKLIISENRINELHLPVVGLSERGLALRGLKLRTDNFVADILKPEFTADPNILVEVLNELPEPQRRR